MPRPAHSISRHHAMATPKCARRSPSNAISVQAIKIRHASKPVRWERLSACNQPSFSVQQKKSCDDGYNRGGTVHAGKQANQPDTITLSQTGTTHLAHTNHARCLALARYRARADGHRWRYLFL